MTDSADNSSRQNSEDNSISTLTPLGSPGSAWPIPVPAAVIQSLQIDQSPDYSLPEHWPEIPGYVIQQHLGEGGFGSVYRAHSIRLNATVAIKILRPAGTGWVELSRRFGQEVSTAARNRHPNVVQVLDSDTVFDVGVPRFSFLVTEFLAGGTLQEWLYRNPRGSGACPRLVAGVQKIRQLCSGLQSLHAHGIVHRDIKPENIMLDQFGNPKLGDFGLCSIFSCDAQGNTSAATVNFGDEDTEKSRLTRDGDLLGTPCYMSPEVLLNSQLAAPASDQYAVGVILYELICGLRPRQRQRKDPEERLRIQEDVELLRQGKQPTPVIPPASRGSVRNQGLQRICLRCLRTDPTTRYADIAALGEDLERWLNGERPAGGRLSEFWNTRIYRPVRRHPFRHLAAVTAALFCMLLMLLAANALNGQSVAEANNRRLNEIVEERNRKNQELNDALTQLRHQLQLFIGTLKTVAELTLEQDLASETVFELRNRLLSQLGADCINALKSAKTRLEKQVLLDAGLSDLARLLYRTGELSQASEVCTQLLQISEACITDFTDLEAPQVREHLAILLLLADTELDLQHLEKAENYLQQLNRQLAVVSKNPEKLESWRADYLRRLGSLQYQNSQKVTATEQRKLAIIKAAEIAQQELPLRRSVRQRQPSGHATVELCSTLATLSLFHYKGGDARRSIEIQEETIRELESILGDPSVADDARQQLIRVCFNGVMPLRSVGEVQQALELGHKGLQYCQDQIKSQPLVLRHQQELGRGYGNQAETLLMIFVNQGEQQVLPETLQNLQQSAEAFRTVLQRDPGRSRARDDAAIQLLRQTVVAGLLNQRSTALQAFLEAVALTRLPPEKSFDQLEPGNSLNAAGALIGRRLAMAGLSANDRSPNQDSIDAAISDIDRLAANAANFPLQSPRLRQLQDSIPTQDSPLRP